MKRAVLLSLCMPAMFSGALLLHSTPCRADDTPAPPAARLQAVLIPPFTPQAQGGGGLGLAASYTFVDRLRLQAAFGAFGAGNAVISAWQVTAGPKLLGIPLAESSKWHFSVYADFGYLAGHTGEDSSDGYERSMDTSNLLGKLEVDLSRGPGISIALSGGMIYKVGEDRNDVTPGSTEYNVTPYGDYSVAAYGMLALGVAF